MKPNWYVINARGMLTLCAGENDARTSAADFDLQWPKMAPHRAVQMVEYAAPAASGEQRCQCGERLASECDEEWGPNCDLGNNPKFARVAPREEAAAVDRALGIARADEVQAPPHPECYVVWTAAEKAAILAYAAAREAAATERVRGVLRELVEANNEVRHARTLCEGDAADDRLWAALAAARAELGSNG